jgi:hypothetical protein
MRASCAKKPTRNKDAEGKRAFSKETKIVDVLGKDRAARPLANKCHVRVRMLDDLAELR